MKNAKRISKKTLSVFLSILMVFSAWVWVAPEKAKAADSETDLANLKQMIIDTENGIAMGNEYFWTDLKALSTAYNNAKRYYDAVTYGGYEGSSAATYYNALQTAYNNAADNNANYIDWLNVPVTSRSTPTTDIGKAYHTNVMWYPYDFSLDFTDANKWTKNSVVFYWTVPNMVVGILDSGESTMPFHTFFTATGNNHNIGKIEPINNQLLKEAKTQDWRVGSSTSTASQGSDTWGDWTWDNYSNVFAITGGRGSVAVANGAFKQASTYLRATSASTGVNSGNTYFALDLGMNFQKADGSSTGDKYTGDTTDDRGNIHFVYMQTYKDNWANWKAIIPNFSLANYNGYTYSSAQNVATYLDNASNLNVGHGLTENDRAGNIDSKVSTWATNLNNGASYLASAKTQAGYATKVSSKYTDLTSAISNADAIYAGGSAPYTYTSWTNFANAYNAARSHMAALSPVGTNNQYSTIDADLTALSDALNNAKAALEYRTYDATYENLFSFSDWYNSASNAGNNTSELYKGEVIADVNAGTITLNAKLNDFYTVHNASAGYYLSTVEPNTTYILDYDLTIESGGMQIGAWFYDGSGNAVTDSSTGKAYSLSYSSPDKFEFTTPEGCTKVAFRIGATGDGAKCTYSNIGLYEKTRADEVDLANWGNRPIRTVFNYNQVLGTTLDVPTRTGYTFNGWWVDTVNPNGIKDEGEQITDGNGNVVSNLQDFVITQNWILYSEWTINSYTVTFKDWDDTVLDTQNIEYGKAATAPANPTKAYDDTNHYNFAGWDTDFSSITRDTTVTATYNTVAHTGEWIETKAPSYTEAGEKTRTCNCGYVETASIPMLEDTNAPAIILSGNGNTDETVYCKEVSVTITDDRTYTLTVTKDGEEYTVDNTANFSLTEAGIYVITATDASDNKVTETVTVVADHSVDTWTSEDDANHSGTCTVCGEKATTTHAWVDATCTTPKTCSVCGATDGSAIAHKNKVHHEKVDATCVATGTIEYWSCPDCSKNFNDEECTTEATELTIAIDPDNHDLQTTIAKAPTCTKIGWDEYVTCQREGCDYTTYKEKAALNHDWNEWKTEKDATCLAAGEEKRTCKRDGCDEFETQTISQLSHSYTGDYKWNNSADPKTHSQKCVNGCGEYGNVTACTFDTAVTKPTCIANGYTTYTCSVCKNSYQADYTTREHVYVYAAGNGTTHNVTCQYDDCNYSTTENCSGGTATCTVQAICEKCKTAWGTKDATAHTGEANVTKDTKDATCTVKGYTGDIYWSCCDALSKKGEEISANGHTFGEWKANDNDTHTRECTVCTDEEDRTETADCTYGEWTENKAPTCEDKGEKAHSCTVCKNTVTAEVNPINHDWDEGVVTTDPTCTTKGVKTYTCQNDASHTYEEDVSALDHIDSDNNGYCDRVDCGALICDHAGQETVLKNDKKETCTEDGYTGDKHCAKCDFIVEYGKKIDKIAHKNKVHHEKVDATCVATGTIEYWSCPDCSKNFSDEECTTEATEFTIAIDNDAHDWNVWTQTTAPTCSAKGEDTRTCKYKAEHKETRKVAIVADAHKWETEYTVDVDPTCETDGSKSYHCEYCDAINEESKTDVPATDHDWGEWELTTAPTTESEGTYTRICSKKDVTDTKSVAREDYTDYDAAVTEAEQLLNDKTLTDAAKEEIQNALEEAKKLDQNLPADVTGEDGNVIIDSTSDETIKDATDALKKVLDKITNDETGVYEKPDYTEAEQAIEDAESIDALTDEEKQVIKDAKQELQNIKEKMDPEANAKDDQDEVDAITEKINDIIDKYAGCASGNHIWDDPVLTKNPTVAEQGEYTETCTVCGATRVTKVSLADYSEFNDVVTILIDIKTKDEASLTPAAHATLDEALQKADALDKNLPANATTDDDKTIVGGQETIDELVEELNATLEYFIDGIDDGTLIKPDYKSWNDAEKVYDGLTDEQLNNATPSLIERAEELIAEIEVLKNDSTSTKDRDQDKINNAAAELLNIANGIKFNQDYAVKPDFSGYDESHDTYKELVEQYGDRIKDNVAGEVATLDTTVDAVRTDDTATKADDQSTVEKAKTDLDEIIAGINDGTLKDPDYTEVDKDLADAKSLADKNNASDAVKNDIKAIEDELNKIKNDPSSNEKEDQNKVNELEDALEDIIKDIDGGNIKPDYTEIDKVIDQYVDISSKVEIPDDVQAEIDKILEEIDKIKNDDTSNLKDDQATIDGLKDRLAGLIDEFIGCASGSHSDKDGNSKCDHCGYEITRGVDGCICHKGNIFSKIIRLICTCLTWLFRTKITCCNDMEYYFDGVNDIT